MLRLRAIPFVALMLGSSLAFGQDKQTEKDDRRCGEPIVGEVIAAKTHSYDTMYEYYIDTAQPIDLDSDCYRWWDDDVESAFWAPYFSGCRLLSATLTMKFGDVDFYDQDAFHAELYVVQFGPGSLDVLKGYNNSWEGMSWDVKDRIPTNEDVMDIAFAVNVDAAHDYPHWAVYLDTALLNTHWGCYYVVEEMADMKK